MSIPIKGNIEIDNEVSNRMTLKTLTPDYLTIDVLRNLSRGVLRSLLKYFSPQEHPEMFTELILMLDIRNQQALGGQKGTQLKMKEEIIEEVLSMVTQAMDDADISPDHQTQQETVEATEQVEDTNVDDQDIGLCPAETVADEESPCETEESDALEMKEEITEEGLSIVAQELVDADDSVDHQTRQEEPAVAEDTNVDDQDIGLCPAETVADEESPCETEESDASEPELFEDDSLC